MGAPSAPAQGEKRSTRPHGWWAHNTSGPPRWPPGARLAHSPERVLNAPSSPLFANAPQKLYELAYSYELHKVPKKEERVLRPLGPDEMVAFKDQAKTFANAAKTGWSAAKEEVTKLCGRGK